MVPQATEAASRLAIRGGFLPPFSTKPCESACKTPALQDCQPHHMFVAEWMPRAAHPAEVTAAQVEKDVFLPSHLTLRRRLAGFLPSLRKPLNQRACSYSPRQPQLSAGDHLQQYRVPAGLICSARQLVQPRDSSTQMTFPSCDKRLLYTDSPTVPSLGLTADGAEFRRTVGDQAWVTSSPPTGTQRAAGKLNPLKASTQLLAQGPSSLS